MQYVWVLSYTFANSGAMVAFDNEAAANQAVKDMCDDSILIEKIPVLTQTISSHPYYTAVVSNRQKDREGGCEPGEVELSTDTWFPYWGDWPDDNKEANELGFYEWVNNNGYIIFVKVEGLDAEKVMARAKELYDEQLNLL